MAPSICAAAARIATWIRCFGIETAEREPLSSLKLLDRRRSLVCYAGRDRQPPKRCARSSHVGTARRVRRASGEEYELLHAELCARQRTDAHSAGVGDH